MRLDVPNYFFALQALFRQLSPTLFTEFPSRSGFLKLILFYRRLHLLDQPKVCLFIPEIMSMLMVNATTLTFLIGEITFRYAIFVPVVFYIY